MVTFLTGAITKVTYDEGISKWSPERHRYKKCFEPIQNGTHMFALSGASGSCCTGESCVVIATSKAPHLVIKGCVACVEGKKNKLCDACVADPKHPLEDCCATNLCAFYDSLPPTYKQAQVMHDAFQAHAKAVDQLTLAAIATKNETLWNESLWLKSQATRVSSLVGSIAPQHQINGDNVPFSSAGAPALPHTPHTPQNFPNDYGGWPVGPQPIHTVWHNDITATPPWAGPGSNAGQAGPRGGDRNKRGGGRGRPRSSGPRAAQPQVADDANRKNKSTKGKGKGKKGQSGRETTP